MKIVKPIIDAFRGTAPQPVEEASVAQKVTDTPLSYLAAVLTKVAGYAPDIKSSEPFQLDSDEFNALLGMKSNPAITRFLNEALIQVEPANYYTPPPGVERKTYSTMTSGNPSKLGGYPNAEACRAAGYPDEMMTQAIILTEPVEELGSNITLKSDCYPVIIDPSTKLRTFNAHVIGGSVPHVYFDGVTTLDSFGPAASFERVEVHHKNILAEFPFKEDGCDYPRMSTSPELPLQAPELSL